MSAGQMHVLNLPWLSFGVHLFLTVQISCTPSMHRQHVVAAPLLVHRTVSLVQVHPWMEEHAHFSYRQKSAETL